MVCRIMAGSGSIDGFDDALVILLVEDHDASVAVAADGSRLAVVVDAVHDVPEVGAQCGRGRGLQVGPLSVGRS
jgi:hypothetical protein